MADALGHQTVMYTHRVATKLEHRIEVQVEDWVGGFRLWEDCKKRGVCFAYVYVEEQVFDVLL